MYVIVVNQSNETNYLGFFFIVLMSSSNIKLGESKIDKKLSEPPKVIRTTGKLPNQYPNS